MTGQGGGWLSLAWRLTVVTVWLAWRLLRQLSILAAALTAALLPGASTREGAVLTAGLAGLGWAVAVGLLGLVSGQSSVLPITFGVGGLIGLLVAISLGKRGMAEAAAASGAVALGTRAGVLGVAQPHVIPRASRIRHIAVFGPTGSGKSTVLTNLVLQDAAAPGRPGLLCIDIKDQLVTTIADHLPPDRVGDVLLFDPSDTAFPPAFNPLADVPPEGRTLAAAEMLAALKRLNADAWGPRLHNILRACLLTLLETPDATLLDIVRLLVDANYRSWATTHVTNISVQQFWSHEFPGIVGPRGSLANVESLLNKLGVFMFPEVRNCLGQNGRGLDLRSAMDDGRIGLAHLPQGVLGEDASNFLAALLVAKVQLASQSRAALRAHERKTFYVCTDEAHNYSTSAVEKLITEGRSMAVGMVTACQYREQLEPSLRLALERNCAYALQCRLIDGKHGLVVVKLQEPDAVDATTLLRPLPPPRHRSGGQLATIRAHSRTQLARPRALVEADIARRMRPAASPAGPSDGSPTPQEAAGGLGHAGTDGRAGREAAGYGRFFE